MPQLRPGHWRALELLETEPLLATRHVEALAFRTGTPLSRARTCRRTLRELAGWGVVLGERAPAGGPGGGSRPATWALTSKGARLLALRDGRPSGPALRPEDRGQQSRAHLLALADLHVALARAADERGALLGWVGEPACWERFAGTQGEELLKPDAYGEVNTGSEVRLAWIELDRGTQSVPMTIQAKVRRYCRAAVARALAGREVPSVMFVTEHPRRGARIADLVPAWAAAEGIAAHDAQRLFTIARPAAVPGLLVPHSRQAA